MVLLNAADDVKIGDTQVIFITLGQSRVWPPATGSQPKISNVSSAGTLTVTWAETDLADYYEVRRNGVLVSTQTARVYNDSGLEWGDTYSYTVTPVSFGIPGSESTPSINTIIPKGKVGVVTPSNRSYTSVTVTWDAVPGATHYRVYRNGSAYSLQTIRSRLVNTSEDSSYSIYVEPLRNGVVGDKSYTYTYYSGRKELRDQGSKSGMVFRPNKVDSWRPVDNWAWLSGIAAQGYFTAAYGNYKGVMYYGSDGVRGELRSKLGGGSTGTDRQVKGTCTRAEVYLYKKPGVGSSGTVKIEFRETNSTASGGEPSGQDPITRTSTSSGRGKWYTIRDGHGQALGDANKKGIMIKQNGFANYAHFTDCRLRLSWSWNYVTQSGKANTWS